MRIAIIEDNKEDRDLLLQQLNTLGHTVSHVFDSYNGAKEEICRVDIDIIITDYLLEKGKTAEDIVLLKKLRSNIKVLVVTSYFEKNIVDAISEHKPCLFLKKGYDILALHQCIHFLSNCNLIESGKKRLIEDVFYVKNGNDYVAVKLDDVYYFEIEGKYVNIYKSNNVFAIRSTLTDMEQRITQKFIRVHQAYLVNAKKIQSFRPSENIIQLDNGKSIPFSRKFKNNLIEALVLT